MPRTGRRRSLTIAVALTAVFAAPAAAQAATYTVKPGDGPCAAPSDLACGSLQQAANAVDPGDVVNVSPGTYSSADFTDANVTITGSTTAPGVAVIGTLTFSGNGTSPSALEKVVVAPSGGTPAVGVTGTAGVAVRDSVLISSGASGILVGNGTDNSITRSLVVSGAGDGAAALVQPGTSATSLTLDSSILVGGSGAGGSGLKVRTGTVGLPINAGSATVTARHITVAGAANGVLLDSSAAIGVGSAVGNIAATVTDSIVLGTSSTTRFNGIPLAAPANSATLSFTRTDQTTAAEALFANATRRNFRLKAGSPAIDKAQITPGDSATDIDGQPRTVGAASDQGADEFVAPPATAAPPANTPAATNDGIAPAVVVTKPRANQRIKLTTTKTKTRTVTKNGKKTKVKSKTSKRTRIGVAGTAKDPSGIKAIVLTIQKISTTPSKAKKKTSATSSAATTTAKKCKWLNATKGVVLKSCTKPPLLLAKVAKDGSWTFNVKSTIRLGAGRYRVIAVGADNSGALGNSAAPKDAIRTFTLTR
ncbi:MAG: choice-of-anchor Q domain-containing protein [Solirubrobacteraceae bacterium]